MAPFSFLLAIARYVRRSAARRFARHSRPRSRSGGSKQLTVTRVSARGMKRGRCWNDEGRRQSVLYYLPRFTALSLLSRATRYFRRNCRFETASRRETRRILSRRRLTLTITYCLELSIYGATPAAYPAQLPTDVLILVIRYLNYTRGFRTLNSQDNGYDCLEWRGSEARSLSSFLFFFS